MAESETPVAPAADQEAASLEATNDDVNALEPQDSGVIDATSTNGTAGAPPSSPKKGGLKHNLVRFNLYLILFVFLLVIAGSILTVAYFQSKKASTTSILKTQALTADALRQVGSSDATVGSTQQILNVQSSAVFAGKVLVREDLEVAGNLRIGGTVALSNITVSGTTQLGQAQINKDLSVAGDTGIQGSLTVAKTLQVNGGGTFSGPISAPQITTSSLQLNSDLILTKHIVTGGPTPSRSSGPALGNGGSSSVNGSDTAGTVTVNIGTSAPAGCFITINFASKYNSTPRVIITPVGSAAGTIDYYVNRTTSSFSICDSSAPPTGSSFAFDYFVVN
ncbi:MAG: hypothetical protein JWO35_270 [Candidatus Saccharibacteria bacterium]|nr:hypothetical protein [Candidatus Saccharibacteria bacterium]